ncbi:MAG: T9SS C-terminal target domain-containing protein [Calditrichaeota bacterium]|nr:MAG: T9SS C-terminal target domain-containing protein [Calditrichota bacterium]
MKNVLQILIIIFLFCPSLLAQQWRFVGLDGRAIEIIVADPNDGNILYAGSTVVEKEGGLYKSTNGGVTWESLLAENVRDFDIHPKNANILYVCAKRFLKSIDKGNTWFYTDSGTVAGDHESTISRRCLIYPMQPEQLLLIQRFGLVTPTTVVYKSVNSGENWIELKMPSGEAVPIAVDYFAPNTVYAGAWNPADIYKSMDFGETWDHWLIAGTDTGHNYDLKITSIDNVIYHLIAKGISGIHISMDQGISWERKNDGLPQDIIITHIYVSDSTFYCIGRDFFSTQFEIYKSDVNKIYWEQLGDTFQGTVATSIFYSKYYNKLFVGTKNGVYYYDTAVNVQKDTGQGSHFLRLKQNYPNPFSKTTTIEYEIYSSTHVLLDLYDITGKRIQELVNMRKEPGVHKIFFSANQSCSGVYFLKLRTKDSSHTKKIQFVK